MQISKRHARAGVMLSAVCAIVLAGSSCTPVQELGTIYVFSEDPGLPGLPTTDPAATRAYLAGLTFATTPSNSTISCDNGLSTTIQIFPEYRSHHLNHGHAKTRGRIVARIRNAGPNTCSDLHLAPGEYAYWWMGPYQPNIVSTHFWSIPPAPAQIRHLANTGETHWYPETQRALWEAQISDKPRHGTGDDGDEVEPLHFGHNSTWIACLGGCCESTSLVEAFF